jgi:tetratricopeptide (TPR) repeat protein
MVGLVFISDAWDKEAMARKTAEDRERQTREQKEEAIRRREEARFNQYMAEINLVQREYEANNIGHVRELLEAQVPQEVDATDFRNFEWYYWQRMAHRELLTLKGHMGSVKSVCFSPDGRRLASASFDQTVRVWDAAAGKELLTLKGHTHSVLSASFSPDGRRLASAGFDQTVRVWDAATGKELLTLKGHTGYVNCVCFSPDGRRLASASAGEMVRVWEATPVPAEVWRQRWLVSQVACLFEEIGLRERVLAALRNDPTLGESDREFALLVAQGHPENSIYFWHRKKGRDLNETSWKVVKARDASKDAYARALYDAETAVRLAPEDGNILNTLGVAQYRVGRYADALDTLTKSEKLNVTEGRSHPGDLAFLAMAQHQLGKKDEARTTLERLRKVMKQSPWTQGAESVGFLREAEELIEGKAAEKGP